MDTANDGSLNRHGGTAAMESNADERARAEAVEATATSILAWNGWVCPECKDETLTAETHLRDCELLRARAEREVK